MPSRPKSKSRGKSVARIATSFPRKKKRNLRKKTRAADGANTKSGGQKGGQDQGIRATIHASVPARLMRKGKKLLYYAAGGGDGNFLGFKVERKSAGGRFAPVDPAHVKVGLVIVRDAKSPIDPAKAEVMKVFQVERNGKREEKGNPVHRVHGHPDRFQVKGGTSSSHKEKCFFAVKVSVVSGEGSDATTISTIANFSPSDGRPPCDRIWLMSKMPKKESDTTKSVAPPSSSNKRKRDEIENNTPRQAKKERVKTEVKGEMAAVKTECETVAVKKDEEYGIKVVTLPLASFVELKKQVDAHNQKYERMRSDLEKLRRVLSDKRKNCCKCCNCAGFMDFTFPFDVITPRSKSTEITQADFSAMHNRTTDVDEDADVDVERVSLQYTRSTESISRLQLDLCRSTSSLRRSDSVKTYDDGTIKTPLLDP